MVTITAECVSLLTYPASAPKINLTTQLVIAIKPIREQVDEKKWFTDEVSGSRIHCTNTVLTTCARQWFGLVLLPLLSYAGDGLNTTMYFIRTSVFSHKMAHPDDFAKAKNIDLAIQFTLLWIPALVLVAWIINTPLTLLFGTHPTPSTHVW
jgi:hypothetical protein